MQIKHLCYKLQQSALYCCIILKEAIMWLVRNKPTVSNKIMLCSVCYYNDICYPSCHYSILHVLGACQPCNCKHYIILYYIWHELSLVAIPAQLFFELTFNHLSFQLCNSPALVDKSPACSTTINIELLVKNKRDFVSLFCVTWSLYSGGGGGMYAFYPK